MKNLDRALWHIVGLLIFMVVTNGAVPASASSGTVKTCFAQTGLCLDEPFRSYWEQNGGLAVFGFPITAPREERNRDTGKQYLTQYFERARFEYHAENAYPYTVLLGRLGADQRTDLGGLPAREQGPQAGCLWFAQTGHNVCDQTVGVGFRSYWLDHGIQDAQLNAYQRSLALFGYPLTAPQVVTNANGDTVLTQWFERARFEYHPNNSRQFRVLLGLVGLERYPDGTFTPPALCQATPNTTQKVVVSAQPSFCIAWRDTFADEQRFLVILRYLNSGEEFRYITPTNTSQLYVPSAERPTDAPLDACMRRKDFQIEVYAVRLNGQTLVGDMVGEGECHR